METSTETAHIFSALHKVQEQITGVERNATNPFHKSRYATLDTVITTARGPLHEAGIVFTQAPGRWLANTLEVTTRLTHAASGQWISATVMMPLKEQTPQAAGSAITYGCRYTLMALLGMPPLDDDGEGAMARESHPLVDDSWKQNPSKQKSAYRARKDGDWEPLLKEMQAQQTTDGLKEWGTANAEKINMLPNNWQTHFREKYEDHYQSLLLRQAG